MPSTHNHLVTTTTHAQSITVLRKLLHGLVHATDASHQAGSLSDTGLAAELQARVAAGMDGEGINGLLGKQLCRIVV
jgi:IS5 family transposase